MIRVILVVVMMVAVPRAVPLAVLYAVPVTGRAQIASGPEETESPLLLKKKSQSGAQPAPTAIPPATTTAQPSVKQTPKTSDEGPLPKPAATGEDKKRSPASKKKAGTGGGEGRPATGGADSGGILGRISKNMRSSEDNLAKKDASENTRRLQKEILEDLSALIDQANRNQKSQSSSKSTSSPRRDQESTGSAKGSRRPREAGAKDPGQPRPAGEREPRMDGKRDSGVAHGKANAQGEMSKLADLYKDVWGHLPETLRKEMDLYSREEFMMKYGDLVKQYYATIAEKSRRKGE